jgi:transposase
MYTERFFDLLLEFGDGWKVKEVETKMEANEVEIHVEYYGGGEIYDYAPTRRWRHLDTMQFKTYINCRLPRMKMDDGKVKTLSPPWADKHERHTFLFESAVIHLLLATKNQTQTANLTRCKFDVVNRIMHEATRRGLERRKDAAEVFGHLSIDEKSFPKRTFIRDGFKSSREWTGAGGGRAPHQTSVSRSHKYSTYGETTRIG